MKRMLWFAYLVGALMAVLVGCRRTPDEMLIRQPINAAAQAAEQVDASALIGQLSDDFEGKGGAMRRQGLGNLLRLASLRGETLHAVLGSVGIEPRGEHYIADFTVTLTSGGKIFPAALGVYKVETAWRKDGRTRQCCETTWTQPL